MVGYVPLRPQRRRLPPQAMALEMFLSGWGTGRGQDYAGEREGELEAVGVDVRVGAGVGLGLATTTTSTVEPTGASASRGDWSSTVPGGASPVACEVTEAANPASRSTRVASSRDLPRTSGTRFWPLARTRSTRRPTSTVVPAPNRFLHSWCGSQTGRRRQRRPAAAARRRPASRRTHDTAVPRADIRRNGPWCRWLRPRSS
jgi:hypothetical protein